ncbi:hypothetical protein C882_2977 [Caenispirillum salinarum AK4]|uniref:Uncharacterized protein n=1 Tax=Caenispirillum salinarum AK4 TaxID=1238182 RepID=K9HNK2_9PROT|nr:hypothetical protein C882_2977 [Caenispirillum salinarum AK4]
MTHHPLHGEVGLAGVRGAKDGGDPGPGGIAAHSRNIGRSGPDCKRGTAASRVKGW